MSDWFGRFGFAEVGDGLLVGAYPLDAEDVAEIAGAGVDVVYNLVEDEEYEAGERDTATAALAAAGVSERRLPLVDYGNVPEAALDRAVDEVLGDLEAGRRVYVHCRAGWQRSATVAAGVLALREGLPIEDALAVLRERKPTAEPLGHQRADLLAWWRTRAR
jgi:ADP-ribosyl-[dinitrogen reductase] hydrolase